MTKRPYAAVAPLTVTLACALCSAGCGSSAHRSTAASSKPAARNATPPSTVNKISAICAQGRRSAAAIPKPATHDPSSPSAIRYEKRLTGIVDRTVSKITSAARSGQAAMSLQQAIAVEDRGNKLVDAEIPALAHHDLARAERLSAQARALTAPADATMRQAGLGICVGP